MTQRMTLQLGVVIALVTTGAIAGVGYLPVCGPSGIRFQTLKARKDASLVLPPLQMTDAPLEGPKPGVTNEMSSDFIGPLLPDPGTPNQLETVFIGPPMPEAQSAVQQSEQSVPSETPMTPQMLLRFFNPGSNKEAVMQAPVEFTPPPPGQSSSATYTKP